MDDLFELMKKLEAESWSGEIQITSTEGNANIVLQEGSFLYAYRPFDRAAERLEKLKWVQLPPEKILSKIRSWEDFVKQILNANPENYDALIRYLKTDRFEIFFRIFFWTNLEAFPRAFPVKISDQPELAFYRPKELSNLLREAQTRLKEWPNIQSRMGSSKRFFISQVPSTDSSIRHLHPDAIDLALSEFAEEMGIGAANQSSFSDEELEIIRLCDGRHSVQDIIRMSPDGEFLTLRRMIDLWDRGIILPNDELRSGRKTSKYGSKSSLGWKDIYAAALIFTLSGILFFSYSSLQIETPRQKAPTEIYQALSIYRAKEGRYPLTLNELNSLAIIELRKPSNYNYRLENLTRYTLQPGF